MAMSIGILELLMARTHLHAADGFWAWPEGYRLVLLLRVSALGFRWHQMGTGVAQLLMKAIRKPFGRRYRE